MATTLGGNFTKTGRRELWSKFLKAIGRKGNSRKPNLGTPTIVSKVSATAPTSSVALDSPAAVGTLCIHYNASTVYQAVYICTAYTDDDNFTWTKITA